MNQRAHDHEHRWLEDGGEAGALVRSIDWAKTPLGPIASWPTSLKTTVGTILHSRHPMFLWWGPELIQFYNDAYTPSFGKGKHPVAMGQAGKDCWQEIWPIIWPQIDDVMSRGRASWNEDQLVPIWRNGQIEEVYWTYGYSPVFDESGSIAGTLVVCTETTARVLGEKRRNEADRAKTALYEERNSLLMQAPVATAVFRGPTHVFELANPLYCRMVGRAELVGKPYLEALPELAGTALPGILDNVYRTGQPFSSGEMLVPLNRGNGTAEECFFTFNLEALRDASGAVYGMMAVALEITDQVNARRSIEKVQQEREGLLAEAQQASRAKDEFFAMLGHELRNPLAPIVMALHLMKQHTPNPSREQEIIERQVGHLVRLVDDLLDVSKIARGKVTLRKDVVELSVVVAAAIEIVSDLFEEHRHQISVDVPQSDLSVFGDPVRLAQVVANLLSNAARYTQPQGQISISAAREDNDVVLIVKDNGVGIGADLLPRVFDLFVQGRRNTDRKEGGLGLGLALVKSLALLHDGKVVARSNGVGRGSEFELRLPFREKKAFRAPLPDRKEIEKRGSPKRILVVDDNVDSAEMMRLILESVGHQVEVANDGPDALAVVDGFSPEIALLDIGLPVMDGYELGKRLHATTNGASCRLIALTGYGQAHDREQSKASGFEAHFVKPVDMKSLLELITSDTR
ncbi:MAG: ATP-binding protein [Polyangiaceae bacterium]